MIQWVETQNVLSISRIVLEISFRNKNEMMVRLCSQLVVQFESEKRIKRNNRQRPLRQLSRVAL